MEERANVITEQKSQAGIEDTTDHRRIVNLQGMLAHFSHYPEDDAECVFELKLPLSMLTTIMLRCAEDQGSPQSRILDALADAGY